VEESDPDLWAAAPAVDEVRLGKCTQKQKRKKRCRGESPKHVVRTSKRTGARSDAAVAAGAAGAEEDSMVDPAAGKALIEKNSQMKQVRQGLSPWGRGTRIHHRSHDDQ